MLIELGGLRFGRLLVIERVGKKWRCVCDCGAESFALSHLLRKGKKRSCGCLRRETTSKTHSKHGKCDSSIYSRWHHMIRRCTDSSHRTFKHYGGRGIKVCERWRTFENFYADMGDPPDGLTLERKDVNGDYCPENCVWASQKTQTRNQRRTLMANINGEKKSVRDWCDMLGLNSGSVTSRIQRGWSAEKAILTPLP